jgi:hypothetical protein
VTTRGFGEMPTNPSVTVWEEPTRSASHTASLDFHGRESP